MQLPETPQALAHAKVLQPFKRTPIPSPQTRVCDAEVMNSSQAPGKSGAQRQSTRWDVQDPGYSSLMCEGSVLSSGFASAGCRPRKSTPTLSQKVLELRPTPSQLSLARSRPDAETWSLRCASEPSLASGLCRSRRSTQSTDGHKRLGSASVASLSCLLLGGTKCPKCHM